jgi:epoxyqueuosine reductase
MKEQLRRIATEMGCAGFGVTTADEFEGVADILRQRNDIGLSGRRRFTYKNPDRAAAVRRSLPWANSLIVVSWTYLPESGSPGPAEPGTGRIARFATADHYEGLRRTVTAIERELIAAGHRAEGLVDDDRLVDRAAAVRAGIAWWGKSTMVLDPKHGPWLLMGSVATSAALDPDAPMKRDCGTCDACLPACPTGAIIAPGVLDAGRCLAHWLQTAGVFPRELRIPLGDRVYGCDDCLDACPPGEKQLPGNRLGTGRVDLLELLETSDEALLARYAHFYMPARRPRILRRNAILALANSVAASQPEQHDAALDTLQRFLADGEVILRLHAAWAIGRVGGERALAMLSQQRPVEADPQVLEEIDLALAGLRLTD